MQSTADYVSTAQYGPPHGAYDEMYLPDGKPRPHWRYLAPALLALGPHELERRADEVRHLVREHGVSYHVYGEPEGSMRPWELDPIPFVMSSQEWAGMEAGLVQRAEVLNLVLKDLYGPRDLIRKGLLPLELIYGHGGFLRPCAGAGFHGAHPLALYAADLGRAPDGRFQVMSDRTQSPSGVGYALANRMIVSRCLPSLFRDAQVHRLSLFFQGLRMALAGLCPDRDGASSEEPRVVLLTPGPLNETYFEQAYLASYLGFTLAQGDDLTVHSGRVWLRALQGLEPVDVILRRVDDHYCDPVELWPESRLGVPGLFEAVRRGNVAVANPLGSSVLENPGLNCFLPRIARHFLGRGLDLPSVMTWWCGEPGGRSHVLARLCDLVIKPIYREFGSRPVFGALLSGRERGAWADRIRARPWAYVGQEVLHPSASPTWVDARILACQTVLRSFLVARPDGYVAMPGGLARAAPDRGPCLISNQAGAIGKDTWVLASEPEHQISLWTPETRAAVAPALRVLPSNAANNLFWLGRYTERAEGTLRILRTALEVWSGSPLNCCSEYGDFERLACAGELLGVLARTSAPGHVPPPAEVPKVVEAVFGPEGYGGLTHDLNAALQSAQSVRDRLDEDAFRVLYEIPEHHTSLSGPMPIEHRHLDALITALAAFSGILAETMIRGQSWAFFEIGRRLERALGLSATLRATLLRGPSAAPEGLLMEATLRAQASLITYRRRYQPVPDLAGVLRLLVTDLAHPRSLAFQLASLQGHLESLPRPVAGPFGNERALIREAGNAVSLADTACPSDTCDAEALRRLLEPVLSEVERLLRLCSDGLTARYLADTYGPQRLLAGSAGV
ncbi:MAG: circularly permuted type 2 ATP-grasp protein [Gammaproteobacteria bacterium]